MPERNQRLTGSAAALLWWWIFDRGKTLCDGAPRALQGVQAEAEGLCPCPSASTDSGCSCVGRPCRQQNGGLGSAPWPMAGALILARSQAHGAWSGMWSPWVIIDWPVLCGVPERQTLGLDMHHNFHSDNVSPSHLSSFTMYSTHTAMKVWQRQSSVVFVHTMCASGLALYLLCLGSSTGFQTFIRWDPASDSEPCSW